MKRIKKVILGVFPLALTAFCFSLSGFNNVKPLAAEEESEEESEEEFFPTFGNCGENLKWSFEENILSIHGTGKMYDYAGQIYSPWFKALSKNKEKYKIIIDEGITSIGSYAFYGCESVYSFYLPESVTTVGKFAFYNFSISTSDGVSLGTRKFTHVGEQAFFNAKILGQVEFPRGWDYIGDSAFEKSQITSIYMQKPSDTAYWGDRIFAACGRLLDVTFGEEVALIKANSFCDCDYLNSVEIPTSLAYVESNAFNNCISLQTLYLRGETFSVECEDGNGYFASPKVIVSNWVPSFKNELNETVYCEDVDSVRYLSSGCSMNGGYWIARHNITFYSALCVTESSTFVLAKGSIVAIEGGIRISGGKTFTIASDVIDLNKKNGMGEIRVWLVDNNYAGIGPVIGESDIHITINGGNISSRGGCYAAGIGCGNSNENVYVTINNGIIKAQGGALGAGIGGQTNGAIEIIINGGDIEATGSGDSVGIGGSADAKIYINGGNVYAESGSSSYGIGGSNPNGQTKIFFNGGTIKATGILGDIGSKGSIDIKTSKNANIEGTATMISEGSLTILFGILAGVFAILAGMFMYLYFKKSKQERK